MDDLQAARTAANRYAASLHDALSAERAARTALRSCRAALEILSGRLIDEGYPRVEGALPRADPASIARIAELCGRRPPRLLELFWEEVGGIVLADFQAYRHALFFRERGIVPSTIGHTTDVVVVEGAGDEWLGYLEGELDAFRDEVEEFPETEASSFLIPLSPDHYHKDDISGGGPYGVFLDDDDWLPVFGGEFAWVGTRTPSLATDTPDFLSYLRASLLECGGFPGLYGCPAFEPLRRRLTAELPAF